MYELYKSYSSSTGEELGGDGSAQMQVLIGINDPQHKGNERQDKQQAIYTIKDTSMSRDDIARVLDTNLSLDHGLEEVSPRASDRDDRTIE